jgi:hypothetical protein
MYNDCWEYDPGTNTWTQKNNFPGAGRYTAAHFVLGNKVYMVGGYFNGTQTKEVWVYNSTNDVWTKLNDFGGGTVQGATGFQIGGTGYIVAGVTGHSNYVALKKAWKYNETNDLWDSIPSFPGAARVAPVSFVINGTGYVGLGTDATFATHFNDIYGFNPTGNSWTSAPSIPAAGRRHAVAGTIGIKTYIGLGVSGLPSGNPSTFFNDLYSADFGVGTNEIRAIENGISITSSLVSDQLKINLPIADNVFIYNTTGQIVWEGYLSPGVSLVEVSGFAVGCYFVRAEGNQKPIKFLVIH